jgi:hypothetical protein
MTQIKKSVRITLNPNIAGNSTFNGRCTVRHSGGEEMRLMKSTTEMWDKKDYDPTKNHYIREMKTGDVFAINYVWDADENLMIKNELHKKEKEVFDFLCSHQNVVFKDELDANGNLSVSKSRNTNMKTPMFTLEILEESISRDDETFTKTLAAMNIVNDMGTEQRKDLVYAYGGRPDDLSEAQIRKWLVDPNNGKVLAPSAINEFLDMMNKQDETSGKYVMFNIKIIFNKAVTLGKIQFRDGQYYSESAMPLGYTVEEVQSYILNNESYASSLKKSLSHHDYLFDIKGELHAEKKQVTTNSILDKDFDTQLEWAKEKKIGGAHMIKDPDLLRTKIKDYINRESRTKKDVGLV